MTRKLNVGSWCFPMDGWINMEGNPALATRPTIISGMDGRLPFRDGSLEAVYCGHVLEHIRWAHVPPFLAECARVLEPGGGFAAVGPDCDRAVAEGHPDAHGWAGDESLWDGTGEPHVWKCTEASLLELVAGVFPDARAVPITDLPEEWPAVSRVWWQCAVVATRGAAA